MTSGAGPLENTFLVGMIKGMIVIHLPDGAHYFSKEEMFNLCAWGAAIADRDSWIQGHGFQQMLRKACQS